jgi:hypothetical protein
LQAKLVHFDELYANPAVLIAEGDRALVAGTSALLARVGSPGIAETLTAACTGIVTQHERSYQARLTELVESMAQSSEWRRLP